MHIQQRLRSALWAAWADALGFISELTDEAGLRRRLAGGTLEHPVEWQRRIGGKFGVTVPLPAGTYSDDTQLRLAVGRAIRPSGFDPEVFSKIELPVWTSYALGGGRASKAAASHIAGASVPWFGNFYKGWTDAGGNGAAMRVQPHVWAAQDPSRVGSHLLDVLIDAVITHGHPRALVGALFHAMTLGFTLDRGRTPNPAEWATIVDEMHQFPTMIRQHTELSLWCSAWERSAEKTLDAAWESTILEVTDMFNAAEEFTYSGDAALQKEDFESLRTAYELLIEKLNLRSPATRGSGTNTVVAALALAVAGSSRPIPTLQIAAQAVGTDTDTIATMAAALAGSVTADEPPSNVADYEYIATEAVRLAAISAGNRERVENFTYPDLLHWEAPRTQAGAVGLVEGKPALAGLGLCDGLTLAGTSQSFSWSWTTLNFGQTVLAKHRTVLDELPATQCPAPPPRGTVHKESGPARSEPTHSMVQQEIELLMPVTTPQEQRTPSGPNRRRPSGGQALDVDAMLEWLRAQGHTDQAIGYAVRRIAELGTTEQMIAFTATIQAEIRLHAGQKHRTF
ncbi:ADP-ribosylglycohydrolase family protein [Streptomyces sp. NRRL S-378]|uniref:ADP-ribosylglycohydrolase family protein n=1 Tax=Streptomyces sp. NRRL S-378 TaxID=1463904 RepID=UPI00131E0F21|nr:ADP-ribosylglycohydrolase family protein [Streptomyces sp. NRRL S-378]